MPGPKEWHTIQDKYQPDLARGPITPNPAIGPTPPTPLAQPQASHTPLAPGFPQPGPIHYQPGTPPTQQGPHVQTDSGGAGPIRHTPAHHSPAPYHTQGHPDGTPTAPRAQVPHPPPQPILGSISGLPAPGGPALHQPPPLTSSPVPSERRPLTAASLQSGRSNLSSAAVWPDTLSFVREHVGILWANMSNSVDFIWVATPMFDIPKHEKWPAAMVLILAGIDHMQGEILSKFGAVENMQANLVSRIVAKLKPQAEDGALVPSKAEAGASAETLKGLVRNNLQIILLDGTLDAYGRVANRKLAGAATPFSAIKALVKTQDEKFLAQFPPDYVDNAAWNAQLNTIITNVLKADKHKLLSLLQSNLPTTGARPRLGGDGGQCLFGHANSVQGCLPHPDQLRSEKHTFWTQLDSDLALRTGKPPMYKFVFARLILRKDKALWDGINTVDSIGEADCVLPTEPEIKEEMASYLCRQSGAGAAPTADPGEGMDLAEF
ncbi:hypothetical protein PtB15_5B364 [Puccinia triticina]|nr:hypothetical protein PtB15_5B364 [Puccinia triticina]